MDKDEHNSYERKQDSHPNSQERLRQDLQDRPEGNSNERERGREEGSMNRDSRGKRDSHSAHRDEERRRIYSRGSMSRSPKSSRSPSPRRSPQGRDIPPRRSPRYTHRNYYQGYSRDRPRRDFHIGSRSPIRYHRKTSRENSSENKGNVLYVSNIPRKISENYLKEKFSKYGKIEELKIIKEPGSEENRGFGFITFEDPKCAEEARTNLDKTKIDDYEIKVELSKRSIGHHPTPGVYLGPKAERRRYGGSGGRYYERRDFHRGGRSRSRSFRRSHSRRRSYHNYPDRSRSRDRRNYRSRSRDMDYHNSRR